MMGTYRLHFFFPKSSKIQNCQIGFLVGLDSVMAKSGRVLVTKPAAESIHLEQ